MCATATTSTMSIDIYGKESETDNASSNRIGGDLRYTDIFLGLWRLHPALTQNTLQNFRSLAGSVWRTNEASRYNRFPHLH